MYTASAIEGFSVIGIEGRTSNAAEIRGMGIIPQLWERYQGESSHIVNRVDGNTVAVYNNYESDEKGAYSLCIGARVSSTAQVPTGMVVREVPPGRYAVFTSGEGPAVRVVPEVWQSIWAEPVTSDYRRNFRTDFELYDTRATNPASARIDVYIGLK